MPTEIYILMLDDKDFNDFTETWEEHEDLIAVFSNLEKAQAFKENYPEFNDDLTIYKTKLDPKNTYPGPDIFTV